MAEPPQTEEGWYALHDFRRVDWDAWRDASERDRERAIEDGVAYLQSHERVADAADGASAVFTILGHEADLLILHLRPTLDDCSTAERAFEQTTLADYTEQTDSYVSVTEVSGYVSDAYFEDEEVDEGLRRYIEGKLQPDIPADTYVSFYPMSKRRQPEQNWYTLPFEERADMMAEHGETGREHAGSITQIVASSVGFEDWEWGVTLFGDDPVDLKDVVYRMRFDEGSAKYGEFGRFYVGRRFPPADLPAFLAGETVPASEAEAESDDARPPNTGGQHGDSGGHHDGNNGHHGDHHASESVETDDGDIRGELADLGVYAGSPTDEDVHAVALYSTADPEELFEEVSGLRENFDHYDTHEGTSVYTAEDADRSAVVSLWETASAAETAAGFLSELPGVTDRVDETEGWGTMGMFYQIEPEHREEFVERFDDVAELLDEMDGHRRTDLLANREDPNDTFIASEWRSREDAMEFFRSDDFRETVQWGRDVLDGRPRHVFLA
jgi:chlorite dismutase